MPRREHHILVLSRELGPSGHTGGFRWHYLMRHMARFGWRFDVICAAAAQARAVPGYEASFDGRVRLIGPEPKAREGAVATEPRETGRRPLALLRNKKLKAEVKALKEFKSDIAWLRESRRQVGKACGKRRYDAVVITSPAYFHQFAGAYATRRWCIPYVADFREPWYFGRAGDGVTRPLIRRLCWPRAELHCLKWARMAVNITPEAAEAVRASLPSRVNPPRYCVTNGAPARDPEPVARERFIVAHVGFIPDVVDPEVFFAGVGRFLEKHAEARPVFQFILMGIPDRSGKESFSAAAYRHGFGDQSQILGRRPKSEADALADKAAVRVAFEPPHRLNIPSKLYHYGQSCGAVLLLAAPGSAMANEGARVGIESVDAGAPEAVAAFLARAFTTWQSGGVEEKVDREGAFLWENRAREMDRLLRTELFGEAEEG